MAKSLCELKKTLKRDFPSYISLVDHPTHVCKRCGRAANRKRLLCKPEKIKKNAGSHG